MAFFKPGERKYRPGVYIRIVNSGDYRTSTTPTYTPPQPSEPEPEKMRIAVTPEGMMYAVGRAFSLSSAGAVVIEKEVDATVYGEKLAIKNQG